MGQYFLSYVAAHPAVTCVVPATTNPSHVRENVLTMHRPLPDHRQRRRMLRHLQNIPEFSRIGATPWYPGQTFTEGFPPPPATTPSGLTAPFGHGSPEPSPPPTRRRAMNKTLTVIAVTAALTAATLTPAAAHSGTAGPYKTLTSCDQARKKFVADKHVVSACQRSGNGYYFKYSH